MAHAFSGRKSTRDGHPVAGSSADDQPPVYTEARSNAKPPPVLHPAREPLPKDQRRAAEIFMAAPYTAFTRDAEKQPLGLSLWTPGPVPLGAVGYVDRASGSFVTLFDAHDKRTIPRALLKAAVPTLIEMNQSYDIQDWVPCKASKPVEKCYIDYWRGRKPYKKRYGLDVESIGAPVRWIVAPDASHERLKKVAARLWMEENIDDVLAVYGPTHNLTREDIILVTGRLVAQRWAVYVNESPTGADRDLRFTPLGNETPRRCTDDPNYVVVEPWGSFTNSQGTLGSAVVNAKAVHELDDMSYQRDVMQLSGLQFRPGHDVPSEF